LPFEYQLVGAEQKRSRSRSLITGSSETRAWLEAKLGPLAFFEVVEEEAGDVADVGAAE
jgi:hypothetical protein